MYLPEQPSRILKFGAQALGRYCPSCVSEVCSTPTLVTGSSGQPGFGGYEIKAEPAITDVVGLTSALAIHDGSGFQTISQLTMYNSNVSLSGSSAFVTPDALEVYNGSAWLAARALKFVNCSVVSQSGSTPVHLEVTPDVPTIADIPNLTTELAGKQPNLQIAGAGTGFTGAVQKIEFTNSQLALTPSTGLFALTAQPDLTAVQGHAFTYSSGVTSLTGHLEATGRLVCGANSDPMGGQALCMKFARPSNIGHYHYMLNGMSSSSDAGNFLRWDMRQATGGHAGNVFKIDATPRCSCSGAFLGTAFTTTSDQSVKGDVQDIDLSVLFDATNVKSYVRTDKPDWPRRIGFIAQHVQSACVTAGVPDTFTHDASQDDMTLLGLDYSRMCCILWSKVKQLEARLVALEST